MSKEGPRLLEFIRKKKLPDNTTLAEIAVFNKKYISCVKKIFNSLKNFVKKFNNTESSDHKDAGVQLPDSDIIAFANYIMSLGKPNTYKMLKSGYWNFENLDKFCSKVQLDSGHYVRVFVVPERNNTWNDIKRKWFVRNFCNSVDRELSLMR